MIALRELPGPGELMRSIRSILVASLIASLGGCYSPAPQQSGQAAYAPSLVDQPQAVDFFYGYVVAARPATVEYGDASAAIGISPRLPVPFLIGFSAHNEPAGTQRGLMLGLADIYGEQSLPNVPAVEYTVLLDHGTLPPDQNLQYPQRPAIVVVQNQYPSDQPLKVGDRAFVRVIDGTAHVMRADSLPPGIEPTVSGGPLPMTAAAGLPDPVPAACPLGPPRDWGERASGFAGRLVPTCTPYYEHTTYNGF
jgi:hypothetical protein